MEQKPSTVECLSEPEDTRSWRPDQNNFCIPCSSSSPLRPLWGIPKAIRQNLCAFLSCSAAGTYCPQVPSRPPLLAEGQAPSCKPLWPDGKRKRKSSQCSVKSSMSVQKRQSWGSSGYRMSNGKACNREINHKELGEGF
ncbi:Thyroid hormone receptor alpha-A [Ophiophagus hannah]|uniref:Thyroid hormone receptor alpha-A n=1 Tax=Ophiophagus hannah TaxID=8665 RepID=V8NTL4_OPHHA|nr:Thyroid hormone receptor alpha-A [Ophiophagus hannah]